VVAPVLLSRNSIAIDSSLKRGITTGFSFYLMTTYTCVRMILCVPICMLNVGLDVFPPGAFFWLARSAHRKWYPWTNGCRHQEWGCKNIELLRHIAHAVIFPLQIDHAESHFLLGISVSTPRFTRFGNIHHANFEQSEFELRLLLWSTWSLMEVWMPKILYHLTSHRGSRLVVFSQEK